MTEKVRYTHTNLKISEINNFLLQYQRQCIVLSFRRNRIRIYSSQKDCVSPFIFTTKALNEYTFFYMQRFVSTQPQCYLTFSALNVAQVLPNTYNHHYIETYFNVYVNVYDQGLYLCRVYVIHFSFSASFSLSLII